MLFLRNAQRIKITEWMRNMVVRERFETERTRGRGWMCVRKRRRWTEEDRELVELKSFSCDENDRPDRGRGTSDSASGEMT